MTAVQDALGEYFDNYGWRFERRRGDLFRTGFLSDSGSHCEIWVRVSDPWVFFTINPFIEKADDLEHGAAVHRLVLTLNHDMNLAKFAIDAEGDLVLSVELPTDGFEYSHFADALTALSHYADLYRERFADVSDTEDGEVV